MSGTLEFMSKNVSGNYSAITSGKFERKTHKKLPCGRNNLRWLTAERKGKFYKMGPKI